MNILILHGVDNTSQSRRSTLRHLQAFEAHAPGHRIVYHYIEEPITEYMKEIPFDVVMFDATFLCWRWVQPRSAFEEIKKKYSWISDLGCLKLAFPQDDYDHAWELDDWMADYHVDTVFTICPNYWDALYPRMSKRGALIPALTGYVDDDDVDFYASRQRPFRERDIDVGYRVRRLPTYFGRFGRLKSELGRQFELVAEPDWRVDISDSPDAVLTGDRWAEFLGNCRFALGCEGGSSILDRRGEVRGRVSTYEAAHPYADIDEVATACFGPEEEKYVFRTFSPRIFEMVMAGCCPILVESDYLGILQPEKHYIPVKRDLSNLAEVCRRLADLDGAEAMAGRAQAAVLGEQRVRYSSWIGELQSLMRRKLAGKPTGAMGDGEFFRLVVKHCMAVSESKRLSNRKALDELYGELERVRSQLADKEVNRLGRPRGKAEGLLQRCSTSVQWRTALSRWLGKSLRR